MPSKQNWKNWQSFKFDTTNHLSLKSLPTLKAMFWIILLNNLKEASQRWFLKLYCNMVEDCYWMLLMQIKCISKHQNSAGQTGKAVMSIWCLFTNCYFNGWISLVVWSWSDISTHIKRSRRTQIKTSFNLSIEENVLHLNIH